MIGLHGLRIKLKHADDIQHDCEGIHECNEKEKKMPVEGPSEAKQYTTL
jgi:hypothetical protein